MIKTNIRFSAFACLAALLVLSACQTTPGSPDKNARTAQIDKAIEKSGQKPKRDLSRFSLGQLEKAYKGNTTSPEAASDYAAKLRESEQIEQAEMILAPFANDPKSPAFTKTEYAAIQLALGDNSMAEKYAQKAVLQDNKDSRGYHFLGIALDATGRHKEAERAFRKALEYWEGDPVPVMNNLALNLAAQEQADEALEILTKAKSLAPDRVEIERNLRIVRALKQSNGIEPPKPPGKPAAKPAAQ